MILDFAKRIAARSYAFFRELWWYIRHILKGTSYAEYYADRMDRIVTRNPDWGLNLNKRFQLEYLKKHGFTPSSTMLDYGCGALAAGIHFIEYLEQGNYYGIDISQEVLYEGERRIARAGLESRQPTLYLLDKDLFTILGERKFDFLWAQSVLTHMPPDDVRNLLHEIRYHMHDGSQLFTTFAETKGKPAQRRFKDWYYNKDFFINEAASHGLEVEFMVDWVHPDDVDGNDAMVRFTFKGGR